MPSAGISSPVTVGVPSSMPDAPQVPESLLTVMAGGAVIVGRISLVTVTVCSAVASLPLSSLMVHITVIVPIGKLLSALLLNPSTAQLSATSGIPRSTSVAKFSLSPMITMTSAGAVMVGASLSLTTTLKLLVVSLPLGSIAVHVTSVVPNGNSSGASLVKEAIPQLSVAAGVLKFTCEAEQIPGSVLT